MAIIAPRAARWHLACLAFFALLEAHPLGAQTPEKDAGLRCEVYCSRDKIRTAKARIFWVGAQMPLAQSRFKSAAPVSEIVEATVYKKGFEQKLFSSLDTRPETIPKGSAFRAAAPQQPALPGLDLKVTEFQRPKLTTEQRSAFEKLPGPAAPEAIAAQETSVEVEGLKPGLKYQWRVRYRGPNGDEVTGIATCVAPTCPADLKE
jgi:hypothetical protein